MSLFSKCLLNVTIALNTAFAICPMVSPAEQPKLQGNVDEPLVFNWQPDSGKDNGRREGGGTRGGECPMVSKPLTAIVPATTPDPVDPLGKQAVAGQSTGEHLTFWFYVPYENSLQGTFELLKDGDRFYQTTIALPRRVGLIGIRLPVNKTKQFTNSQAGQYQWSFAIECNADSPSQNPTVYGRLERSSSSVIKSTAFRQQILSYTRNGIWFEPLTLLAERRLATPSDPTTKTDWTELLRAVRLESVAHEPIVQLYMPK